MSARTPRVWAVGVLAAAMVVTVSGIAILPAGAADANTYGASAVTKEVSEGPFAGLSVKVSKTENLVNEVVEVTWAGAKTTEPSATLFYRHFMQVMQCWGDDAAGPRPEQCQFGASGAADILPGGAAVTSRQLRSGALPVDEKETRALDFLPFDSVTGDTYGGKFEEFSNMFDAQISYELPLGATRGDGSGQEFFEVHTAAEAPGLGCGRLVGSGKDARARSCWLVVVPRGDVEVDGTLRQDSEPENPKKRLQSSPLSASNWANRIAFPLKFQPIGGACAQGGAIYPVLGHENATEAITRWQQSLCAATGAAFDFSQLTDGAARAGLAGSEPGMAIVGRPLDVAPTSGQVVYAPIAVSGLGFAYIVEARTLDDDPPEVRKRAGQRIADLKLTQRLVAKLLSQSYTNGVKVVPDAMKDNPLRIEDDPEFQALNPSMAGINTIKAQSVWTVITPLNPADANRLLWQWIAADGEARDFLVGKPDPSGMVVNPAWKDADLGADDFSALKNTDSFPKLDQTCKPEEEAEGGEGKYKIAPLCPADAFPYSNDMHDSVQAANRGDTLARDSWNQQAIPPIWTKSPPQKKGFRGIMVVADAPTAARYNLPMAALRNAKGKFVKPDSASLLANVAALKASSARGVLTADANVKADAAYPLTTVSYAATVPAALTAAERKAYAGFVTYAAGDGQRPGVEPGSLPAGYAPLPKALVDSAKAAAASLRNYKAPAPAPTPKLAPKPSSSGAGGSGGGAGGGGSPTTDGSGADAGSGSEPPPVDPGPAPGTPPDAALPDPLAPAVTPGVPTANDAPQATGFTSAIKVGNTARYSLLWLLALALLAAFGSRAMPYLRHAYAPQRPRPGVPRPNIRNPAAGRTTAKGAPPAPEAPQETPRR